MSYKVRYEYDVLAGGAGIKGLSSRGEARVEKRALEAIDGVKHQIIQRKYVLNEIKIVH